MREATITEDAAGWIYGDNVYSTAVAALNAVRRGAEEVASVCGKDVVIVNWNPKTRIGMAVVQAITSAR